MNPRSSRPVSKPTTRGKCAAPKPDDAAASAARAESRTPCARLRRQLAIFSQHASDVRLEISRGEKSEQRRHGGGRRRSHRPALPLVILHHGESARGAGARPGAAWSPRPGRSTVRRRSSPSPVPSSSSIASSAASSPLVEIFPKTVAAAARMCSAFEPSTSYPRPSRPAATAAGFYEASTSEDRGYDSHGSAHAKPPMVAAAVDATSAPASPSEATASGAKYPLIVAGGNLAGFRRARQTSKRATPSVRLEVRHVGEEILFRGSDSSRESSRAWAPRSATRAPIAETPRWPRRASRSQAIGATRETPGANTPITAPARGRFGRASGVLRARRRRHHLSRRGVFLDFLDFLVVRVFGILSGTLPERFLDPALAGTRTRTAASRNRSNAAAAACRSAMSDPLSSCMTWCRSGTAAAGGLDANHAASSVSYARMRRS